MRLKIEAGKRYVRRDEKITDPLVAACYRGGLLDPKNQYYYIDGGDGTERFCGTHMNLSYDLISEYVEPKTEPSLQQLCDNANAAHKALSSKMIEVQYRYASDGEAWTNGNVFNNLCEFRPKPLPVFETFVTSNGHQVRMEDRFLRIGCHTILPDEVKRVLTVFEGGKSQCGPYSAIREGIVSNATEVLPWSDADRILKQLREMQGDK